MEMRKFIQGNLTYLENNLFSVELKNMDLQVKPSIFIQRIEISEKMPIVEGIPLLIACIVQGGPDTKVKWLKDLSPIVFSETRGRLWNSAIPKNSFNSFTFLLGIDKTHHLDSGTFTCKAEDETGVDKLTIPVTVTQLANPLLTPLSATIRLNDSLTITCVSQDIHQDRNVMYIWFRNEGPLFTAKEKVEDLFPSGSRVIINKAVESANYTCAIYSTFGIKKETSVIRVVRSKELSTSTCPKEVLFGINWKLTAVDSEDIHLCPHNYTGYIFRKCIRKANHSITWQQPDFSRCISSPLLKIKNGFESYKIGYRIHSLNILLKKTLDTLSVMMSHFHMSEAEPLIDILSDIDSDAYLRENATENWKIILNITSKLLNSTAVSHIQSKQKMNNFIRNISISYGRKYITHNSSQNFKSSFLRNSSMTAVIIVYRGYTLFGNQEFPNGYTVPHHQSGSIPVIVIETKCTFCGKNYSVKAFLTYKHIIRNKKNAQVISCYKISGIKRYQNIQPCESIEIFKEDIVCQCYSTGLLYIILLEKKIEKKYESSFSTQYKIIPLFASVISITFFLCTLSISRYRRKFSSLFD